MSGRSRIPICGVRIGRGDGSLGLRRVEWISHPERDSVSSFPFAENNLPEAGLVSCQRQVLDDLGAIAKGDVPEVDETPGIAEDGFSRGSVRHKQFSDHRGPLLQS